MSALIVFGNVFSEAQLLLFMVFKQEHMALPAHGLIIEKPEEDYRGEEEIKQAWKEKDSFGKKDEATARKNEGGESGAARDKICLESVQPHVSNS